MRRGISVAAAALLSGCTLGAPSGSVDAGRARGDGIVLTEEGDPYRQTRTYQHAAAYCAERGETAVLRSVAPRLGGRRAYTYDCVHTVTRRGG